MEIGNHAIATEHTFRNYVYFWIGQLFSILGSSIVQFSLIWWITEESQSATVLSLVMVLYLLPQIFVTFFFGVYIDRWNRKKIILIADSC